MESPGSDAIFSAFWLRWICVFICVGIVIVGLWPFNLLPENQVAWLQGENGIHFEGRGLVYGPGNNFGMVSRSQGGDSLTVELWIKPDIEPDSNLPVFLTIYDWSNLEAIALAQWCSELIVPWQNLGPPLVFKEFGVTNALNAGERRIITITFNGSRTAVYVDGRLKGQHPANLLSTLDKQSMGWVLGNAPNGSSSWKGDLFGLAVYDRSIAADDVSRNYEGWLRKGLPRLSRDEGLVGLFRFSEHAGEFARSEIRSEDHFRIARFFEPRQREIHCPLEGLSNQTKLPCRCGDKYSGVHALWVFLCCVVHEVLGPIDPQAHYGHGFSRRGTELLN